MTSWMDRPDSTGLQQFTNHHWNSLGVPSAVAMLKRRNSPRRLRDIDDDNDDDDDDDDDSLKLLLLSEPGHGDCPVASY